MFTAVPKTGTVTTTELKKEIQELSFQYLLLVRTGRRLLKYQNKLEEVAIKFTRSCRIETPQDIWEALEIRNLIQVGRIIAQAGLARKETRGGHYREDYPQTNAKPEWIIVRRDSEAKTVVVSLPTG